MISVVLTLVANLLQIGVSSGGAQKLNELFNKHKAFLEDVAQMKKELKPPKEAKGYD